jgi:hypothetical protein
VTVTLVDGTARKDVRPTREHESQAAAHHEDLESVAPVANEHDGRRVPNWDLAHLK